MLGLCKYSKSRFYRHFLPREVSHNTSIRVPDQYAFEHKFNNTQLFPLFENVNLTHEGIFIKIIPISNFLVHDGFDADLDTITIYSHIKTLYNLAKPDIQALLTLLQGCMTSRLINDAGTFIMSNVFMDSIPPADRL